MPTSISTALALSVMIYATAIFKAAVAISLFIGAFWTARVATDLFYFGDEDWPRGALFEIGHIALTALFGVVVPLAA